MADTRTKEPTPSSRKNSHPRGLLARWLPRLLWIACGLVALSLIAAGAFVLWLRSAANAALPQLDGGTHLAGLSAPVAVRRDRHDVPHIEAASQSDLFVAQGYVTAQDRLWQMDALRRNAQGELAEILGASLVIHDKTQRVLQIRRTAERVYAHSDPADRARFDDYARGVNLYIAECKSRGALPFEFKLLHYQPRPWTGVDSVSVGLMMVETLDTRIVTKLSRERIAAKLGDEKLESDLYPVGSWRDRPPTGVDRDLSAPRPAPVPKARKYNDDEDDEDENENTTTNMGAPGPSHSGTGEITSVQQDSGLEQIAEALGQVSCEDCGYGSNNWVIAGSHTASGKPLLANDMHLALTEPDTWYIADLRAPGYHAAGVTLPGVPYVIAGHNEHVAWGFTALMGDVQDLYVEKLDGHGQYEGNDGQWHALAKDPETIHVRGGRDVTVNVESTEQGPLLNPLMTNESRAIALKWTLYDPQLNSLPLYAMNTASNWTEFSAALAQWCWPTQNVVYSDDQGHIGYHAAGKVPIRGGGTGLFNVPVPHDTSDTRSVWGSSFCAGICPVYIPFDQMPNSFDPPSGFLATANSRVTTDASLYPISDEWIDPYRVERIYKMLGGRDKLTAAQMLAAQTDVYSEVDQEMGQRFAYAVDQTPGPKGNGDPQLRQAADLLRSWDGKLTTDSAAASVVTRARAALWPLILEPKLGKLASDYHWGERDFAEEEIVMHAKPEWLPKGYANWNALLTEAVRRGIESGNASADLKRWNYGSWHRIEIEHPLVRFLPFLKRIAGTGPQPIGGDGTTVQQIGAEVGPSQRFTMDWSNVDGSTENIVLGESGNPLSPYFRDQWKDWYKGTTFALPFSAAAVQAQTRHTLELRP
jgi:penicillin G amidase